jgi:hypothetical protein
MGTWQALEEEFMAIGEISSAPLNLDGFGDR